MQWIEVNVAVTHEAVEAVADMLTSIGSKGVAIEDPQLINDLRNSGTWELCDIPEQENTEVVTVSAYYADDEKLEKRLAEIEEQLELIEERGMRRPRLSIFSSGQISSRPPNTAAVFEILPPRT